MTLKISDESLFQPVLPSKNERKIAAQSLSKLSALLGKKKADFRFSIDEEFVAIPQSAAKMLLEILSQMAQGNPVVLTPAHAELTTQQAADAINVSRPFLVKLLEAGEIAHRKVGSHRRIMFDDLMAYKQRTRNERLKVLEELQKDAEDNDMGY